MEAVLGIERAEAAEAGVHHPQLVVAVIGHLVDVDVAGDVDAPGQIAGVVLALGLELRGHGGHVAVVPDGVGAADGEPGAVGGDAHGLAEGAEVGVERRLVVAHQDDLAGLVGGDHQTDL